MRGKTREKKCWAANHVIIAIGLYLAVDRYWGLGGPAPALVNCLGAAALGSLAPAVGHRGFTHFLLASFLVFLGLAAAKQYHPGWFPYFAAFGIGYFSHVLADWLTTEGVPLFWPDRRRFRSPLSFRTGGLVENLFGLAAGLGLGIWLYRFWLLKIN